VAIPSPRLAILPIVTWIKLVFRAGFTRSGPTRENQSTLWSKERQLRLARPDDRDAPQGSLTLPDRHVVKDVIRTRRKPLRCFGPSPNVLRNRHNPALCLLYETSGPRRENGHQDRPGGHLAPNHVSLPPTFYGLVPHRDLGIAPANQPWLRDTRRVHSFEQLIGLHDITPQIQQP
jgi:hypothetical protein